MTPHRRFRAGLLIAAVLLAGTMAYTFQRLLHWHHAGWAGVSAAMTFPGQKRAHTGPVGPGDVVVVLPGTPADKAGLRRGDHIESVNGIKGDDLRGLTALDQRLKRGDEVIYRIERNGKPAIVRLRLESPFAMPRTSFHAAITVLVASAFFGIGLLVFWRKPEDPRAVVFFGMAVLGTMSMLISVAGKYDSSNSRGITAATNFSMAMPYAAAGIGFTALVLHLALIFPRPRPIVIARPYIVRWIYSLALVGFLLSLSVLAFVSAAIASASKTTNLDAEKLIKYAIPAFAFAGLAIAFRIARAGRKEGMAPAFLARPISSAVALLALLSGVVVVLHNLGFRKTATLGFMGMAVVSTLGLVGAYTVITCLTLYRSYRDAGVEEKRQVKWPLWGTFIALAAKIVVFATSISLVFLSGFKPDLWEKSLPLFEWLELLPRLATLLIPISFAFAIFKYRLMNIDVIIRKTVSYAILSTAIVILYLGLVGGLGTVLVSVAGVHNQTMIIAATLVVAALFVPLRNKLQTLVDRNLFRHRYEYPEALRAIAGETLSATDLAVFLASAAEKIQRALQNRAVVIFSSRHDELVASAKVGLSDSLLGSLRIAKAPTVVAIDRPLDPRRHQLPDDAAAALKHIEAELVVPVNTPGTPANGIIALAGKLTDAPFDVEDIEFLKAVADQLDLGMDRIHAQREEADFAQAREIQQTLLPRDMPRIEGLDVSGIWQPARTMGGDYYDFIQLADRELAICIGDVAGKGMSAALTMSGLQAAVRASASNSPRDVCERVRRVVVSSLSGGRFVTFFYATVDTAAMRLRWCNAGHNAPILIRADGTIIRLAEGGPMISRLCRDIPYDERELPLLPGDRLVLFTDGVSEVTDASGEQFGETRIEELVAAHRRARAQDLQHRIVEAAINFGGGELEDDLTLVAVTVNDEGGVLS